MEHPTEDVPPEQMDLYQQYWWHTVHTEVRVPTTKWVVLRYPSDSFAQAASMSTRAFEDFYFDVCTADYAQMAEAQKPLIARMEAADRVYRLDAGSVLRVDDRTAPEPHGLTAAPLGATSPSAG